MPLTVLESIACGTPVVSTHFKALNRFKNIFDGIKFYNSFDDLKVALDFLIPPDHIIHFLKYMTGKRFLMSFRKIPKLK